MSRHPGIVTSLFGIIYIGQPENCRHEISFRASRKYPTAAYAWYPA